MMIRTVRMFGAAIAACLVFATPLLCLSARAARADDHAPPQPAIVQGTIVSVRANVLQIRPYLRHVWTRVSVSPTTSIVGYQDVDKSFLKPGLRIMVRGRYSKEGGFRPRFMDVSEKPSGQMAIPSHGLTIRAQYGFASCTGNLKSVKPFVFTDDDGKDYTASLADIRGIRNIVSIDHNALMIGSTVQAVGIKAADGVVQAQQIVSLRFGFDKPGTMFGKILSVSGNTLTIQPRYTTDTTNVSLAPDCRIQQQIEVDADTVKVGDPVTFWAQKVVNRFSGEKSNALLAIALTVGSGRYPAALADKDYSVFISGKLASLNPVQVAVPGGKRVDIVIPALMAVARVRTLKSSELKAGSDAMFLLTPQADGGFQAQAIVVDASPWLGYGT